MPTYLWIIIGSVAAVALYRGVFRPSLNRAIDRALRTEDVRPLLAELLRLGDDARPTAFNRAIRHLWDAYQRPLAVELIRALVEHNPQASIGQYWLQQVLTVEPELAREALDQAFVSTYYQPHVAASCGDAG